MPRSTFKLIHNTNYKYKDCIIMVECNEEYIKLKKENTNK